LAQGGVAGDPLARFVVAALALASLALCVLAGFGLLAQCLLLFLVAAVRLLALELLPTCGLLALALLALLAQFALAALLLIAAGLWLTHRVLPRVGLLALLISTTFLLLAHGVLARFDLLLIDLLLALAIVAALLLLLLLLLAFGLAGFTALTAFRLGIVQFAVVVGAAVAVLRRGRRPHAQCEGGAQRNGPESLLAKGEFHVGFLASDYQRCSWPARSWRPSL
jgi:hypothetical protein